MNILLNNSTFGRTWIVMLALLISMSFAACSLPAKSWTQDPDEIAGYHGTDNGVFSVAFSANGRTLMTGCWNDQMLTWDTQTSELLGTLEMMDANVPRTPNTYEPMVGRKIFLSPDGATGARTIELMEKQSPEEHVRLVKELMVWNVQTGELLHTLTGYEGRIKAIAFSPDGKLLAGGGDKLVLLWNMQTGRSLGILEQMAPIKSLAFSPDSKTLAVGGLINLSTREIEGIIYLWDMQTREMLHVLTGHTRATECLAFSPDSRILASGGWDGTMRLWDVQTGRQLKVLTETGGPVLSVAFSPDGKTIASGGSDGKVRLWDAETGVMLRKMQASERWSRWMVSSVAFSPDGETLAAGVTNGNAIIWNVKTGKKLKVLSIPNR